MARSTSYLGDIENRNFLAPQGFKLSILKFPKVSYICQAVDIPGVSIPDIVIPNPFRDYSIAGTETNFEDLTVRFLVDENLENYTSILKWLKITGLAEGYDTADPIESQIILQVLNSNFNTICTVEYDHAFPISLSKLTFDASQTEVNYMTSDVTFKYSIYRIKNKNGDVIS